VFLKRVADNLLSDGIYSLHALTAVSANVKVQQRKKIRNFDIANESSLSRYTISYRAYF
jgi:hypothetical protein